MASMTRTQIQIDCSPELRQKLRVIAISNGMSLRELVLKTLAGAYPEVAKMVEEDLA